MRAAIAILIAAALSAWTAPNAVAQANKGAKAAECLNPLVCGPQKVPQRRKPAKEQFMRSAS